MKHIPVLLTETLEGLNLEADSIVVDCTLGSGGHARAILAALGAKGRYIGIDVDQTALDAQEELAMDKRVTLVRANFKEIKSVLQKAGVSAPDAILADLGWRTEQFQGGGKGFSFNEDEPLQMTFGNPEDYAFTAYDIANEFEEESIADIIYGYGEERSSRKIARAIVAAREEGAIKTSGQFAALIESVMPRRFNSRIHPATKTFQAFRMAVNDELGVLKTFLEEATDVLNEDGRLAIITFHSLEDRIVKHFFKDQARDHNVQLITKKPITASREEVLENPRARSAKLRIIQKNSLS